MLPRQLNVVKGGVFKVKGFQRWEDRFKPEKRLAGV